MEEGPGCPAASESRLPSFNLPSWQYGPPSPMMLARRGIPSPGGLGCVAGGGMTQSPGRGWPSAWSGPQSRRVTVIIWAEPLSLPG
jgi:hypothetical protein